MQATHFDRQEDRQRIEELDIVKALGIICMVAGHSDAPFTHFIYLFHMAVFFMAAGFFFKDETSNDFRCDVNDKQKYSSKKISSLSLLSVLSRASSCAHVFCLPKSKNEQIPAKSVHCIKFMQMCQKKHAFACFFCAPAGLSSATASEALAAFLHFPGCSEPRSGEDSREQNAQCAPMISPISAGIWGTSRAIRSVPASKISDFT